MSHRLALSACAIVVLSILSAPAALADIIIVANQSCRTTLTDPAANNHDSSKLSIRSDNKSSKAWIKFDVRSLNVADLEAATLTVTLIEPKDGNRHFDVSYVNDDCRDNIDWDDRSITWNNAPGNNTADFGALDPSKTTFLATVNFTNGVAGDKFTINVLEALLSDTDGIVQFVCYNSNGLMQLGTHDHADETWRPFIDATEGAKDIAKRPSPPKGATDVSVAPVLSWVPGAFVPAVNGHKVYLSDSLNDVNDGIGGVTTSTSSYSPALPLAFGTTYYWRVDEVNGPPDFTVHKGPVWSFTTEPFAYPIAGTNITATASSVGDVGFGPEKTIDGSGLDDNDLHSTNGTDIWLSADEPLGAWIQYEFDKVYKLHEMWVWNFNQAMEQFVGLGMKDVTVEYSSNGLDWTVLANVPQFTKAPGTEGYAHNTTVAFGGAAAKYVKLTATSNWGGIMNQYGLSEVRFFAVPVAAREPSPASGATGVDVNVTLGWRAGREAAKHEVYIGTDPQAVTDGSVPAVAVSGASYSPALDLGSTYFWRIDEVNDAATPATWQGDVWSFSTTDFIAVEDFESYNDIDPPDAQSHRIFESWIDGYGVATNGALVGYDPPQPSYAETKTVHEGRQSMPLFYSNTAGATYSEAKRTFAAAQDWTKHGVKTLTLYFFGAAGNTGQLYVKINGTKVPYNGAAANLAVTDWQAWDIDLATAGVNPQSVASLAIGIDGNAAAGTLYFDDIRLR